MANYTIDIEIAKEWVDIYNGFLMKLCMAKAVKGAGGKELYNVIVKTVDELLWTDEYTISATTQYFSAGVYISPMPVAPGMTSLTPIPKVVFWFQDSVNTSTMITHFLGSSITVKPTPGSEHSKIKFNKEGKWETVV
ncbi:hypothetical protein TrVFT333_011880 [Trichoderma virens FT-333]|nr:hypothetical protein TrVFT333_011880 [Trichoderma virens FT-333]